MDGRMSNIHISSLSVVIIPWRRSSSPSGIGETGLRVHVLFVESAVKICRNSARTVFSLSFAAVGGDRGKSVVSVNGVG
jgi:hypothetical protein